MTPPDPQLVIRATGITGVVDVQPVGGGMSGAILWRVRRQEPKHDLLLRLFPPSGLATVEREATIQRFAIRGSVPAPAIRFVGLVASCPVMVMDWVDGQTILNQLFETPGRANVLGWKSGKAMAALHALPIPDDLPPGGTMAHWLGECEPWLRDLISIEPTRRAIVHADFHPLNLMTDGETVTSVLDWTNGSVAHPLVDLGRSFACLRLGSMLFADTISPGAMDQWWRGLVTGYGATDLSIADLAPFFAFGLVTVVSDRLQIASNGIPEAAIAALIPERDAWLDLARKAIR